MTALARRWGVALAASALALLGACGNVLRPPPHESFSGRADACIGEAREAYARVLRKHVNAHGEVDFAALRDDATGSGLPALEAYVRAIADTPLDAAPTPAARLAHMINAYNALSMYGVIRSDIPASHAGLAKLRFFVLQRFVIGGRPMSLYTFENEVIRKQGEPRVHFALNCSAVSCPELPREPFSAEALDAELEHEARAFFSKPANLRVDHGERTVRFSEILKFYAQDFVPAHAQNLIAYTQRYTDQPIPPDYAIAFTPYDWTVANSRRPR